MPTITITNKTISTVSISSLNGLIIYKGKSYSDVYTAAEIDIAIPELKKLRGLNLIDYKIETEEEDDYIQNSVAYLTTVERLANIDDNTLVFDTDLQKLFVYNSVTQVWQELLSTSVINLNRIFIVTTPFPVSDVIDLTTGLGGTGIATVSGDIITLSTSAAAFNLDGNIQIYKNGQKLLKGVQAIWDSTTTLHFNSILDIGDYFDIIQFSN